MSERLLSERSALLREWTYRFLLGLDPQKPIPSMTTIGLAFSAATGVRFVRHRGKYAVLMNEALIGLERRGLILRRHGTRSEHRSHQAIRIVSTGNVLKTAGCPFDAPELRVGRKAA